jgi:hypothetical protein
MNAEIVVAEHHSLSPSLHPSGGLEVVAHDAGMDGLWDDLVARARNGHFMVTRRFLDYHGGRFQDRSLLFLRGGRPVAALPLHADGTEWVSHRGLPFGGLIVAPELTAEQTAEVFHAIGMRMLAAGVSTLRYTPAPLVYHTQPFEDDVFVLHSLGARLAGMKLAARARLPRLGLMQERVRKYLRQAVPKIRVFHGIPLPEFWDGLTSYLHHRHSATPVHTELEMADLMNRFPDAIKLLGVRGLRRRLVAGSLVFLTSEVIRFQYAFGAGDPAAPKQSLLALDHAAIRKFGAGRGWVDFGTSMHPASGRLDDRLHAQKERNGGRGMRVETWVWDGGRS